MNINSLHRERPASQASNPKVGCIATSTRYCPASTKKPPQSEMIVPAFAGFYAVIRGACAVMTPSHQS